jgi:hypothetical protein
VVITDKSTREVILKPGKTTDNAATWGKRLAQSLLTVDRGLPKQAISNRDPKFLSDIWSTIWRMMGTDVLYSTASHPQTDGQSERMLRFAESALRHYFPRPNGPSEREDAPPFVQFEFKNTKSAVTGMLPNEAVGLGDEQETENNRLVSH